MDTYTIDEVAEMLGTTRPRVQRAIRSHHLCPTKVGRGVRLDESEVSTLRRILGSTPHVDGLTREDLFVLRALSLSPFGLRSVRSVARKAQISPTTAARSLDKLIESGFATQRQRTVIEGEVVDAQFFDVADRWWDIADVVRTVHLPDPYDTDAAKRVPLHLRHHFWNAPIAALDVAEHDNYIASRLLRSGDPEALAWVVSRLSPSAISSAAAERGMSEDERLQIRSLAQSIGAQR